MKRILFQFLWNSGYRHINYINMTPTSPSYLQIYLPSPGPYENNMGQNQDSFMSHWKNSYEGVRKTGMFSQPKYR